jgi:hypothetical protein
MTLRPIALAVVLCAAPALAQPDAFATPGKEAVFKEDAVDRKFARSQLAKALAEGTNNPNCVAVLGGLFTLLAEVGPTLHKRDENFTLDPLLLQSASVQLNNAAFPGNAYLVAMVRRVLIDKKVPQQWLQVANDVNKQVGTIDMGKMRFMADGLKLIDSFQLTLPALRHRYDVEIGAATASSAGTSEIEFRDRYVDREVAFGALELIDIGPANAPQQPAKGTKGKKKAPSPAPLPDDPLAVVAHLRWNPPWEGDGNLTLFANVKRPPPILVTARLKTTQYLDVHRLPKGTRLLARGRLWKMEKGVGAVELRDALLFEDRDWNKGAFLADPNRVAQCPFAINELTGVSPQQPGGFAH